jgi:DNA polymerase III delta prime subunit
MWHVAVGLGLVVVGSAVAYYYNEKTDDEKDRQKRAYKKREDIHARYKFRRDIQNENYRNQRKLQAEEYKRLLLKEIEVHFEKVDPITNAYQELYDAIIIEISSDTTSPYRKSALKKEFSRIEDAQIRISEYAKYLEFERATVNQLWDEASYDLLLDRPISDALLPMEWLYPGKLLVVELDDMDRRLNNSCHILKFFGFDGVIEQQKALALSYGSEFPILIVKNNHNQYYGCVARGIIFHDYIRLYEPLSMTVERFMSRSDEYLCTFNDGLVRACLPKQALLQPGIRCVPGQRVDVYFENYDAVLQSNPFGALLPNNKKPFPSVTEKSPTTLGYDDFELFIEADLEILNKIPSESSFYSDFTQWSLLDFNLDKGMITLGKGEVEAQCKLSENNDGLVISKVFVHQIPQVGVDLPFDFILLSSNLSASEIFGWSYGIEQLFSFASQAFINSTTARERVKQVEFFRRWERVVEYQKQQESTRSVEFELVPHRLSNSVYLLTITSDVVKKSCLNDKSIYHLMKEIETSESLHYNRSIRLLVWDPEHGKYLPAVEYSRLYRIEYRLDNGNIEIEAPLNDFRKLDFSQQQKFQLVVQLPNTPLFRQQMALDALFEDRMVEPHLKEIFLAPSSYNIQQHSSWAENDIAWSGRLTDSQKHAIKVALSAKHIAMIQGPPGTGKTTTIVEMLYQLLQKNPNQKILVVSQQNTAVDNAITKFKNVYPHLVNSNVNIVRVGNPAKIDDDMSEDHFDFVFRSFIEKCLDDTTSRSAAFADHEGDVNKRKLDAIYEWRALLMQINDTPKNSKVSDEFFATVLANTNLIGATCVGLAARHAGIDHVTFDVAIVDEAGRATVPELLIPLLRSRKAILIGDHHQLPPSIAPVLREDSAKDEMTFLEETFLETSFFEALFEQLPDQCTASLAEQFRMSKPIGDLVAELFYTKEGVRKLHNGNDDPLDTTGFVAKNCLVWVDVWGKQFKRDQSTSLENKLEAEAICSYLNKLSTSISRKIDVAVITPYGDQKRLIRKALKFSSGSQHIKLGSLTIKVDTVDSFQGSEAELVCYSTVRTQGSLQFLLDKKRLNVACSRAKENLMFFGNIRALESWQPKSGEVNLFKEIIKRSHKEKYIPKHIKQRRNKNINRNKNRSHEKS